MSQFSSDKPQVFIPPAFEDFRGYLSVPYDRSVRSTRDTAERHLRCGDCIFRWGSMHRQKWFPACMVRFLMLPWI